MAGVEYEPIIVSRQEDRRAASWAACFQILADPGRHRDLDGSGMVAQEVVSGSAIWAWGTCS